MSTAGATSESQLGWITEKEWTITIEDNSQLPIDRLRSRPDVSIFRVPNSLMKESKNGEAYIPQRVSLGPYHHRSAKLRSMDSHKGRALNRMMMRYNTNTRRMRMRMNSTNVLVNMKFSVRAKEEISKLENEIKKSYQEEIISCDGETTLGLMLSLDGCFILEILRTLGGEFIYEARNCYEPIFEPATIDHTGKDILRDILMLENQIPLTVLQKLLELELNQANVNEKVFKVLVKGLWDTICPFTSEIAKMDKFLQEGDKNANMNKFLQEGQVHHILGFCHKLIVSPPYPVSCNPVSGEKCTIHHVVELINAGIKYCKCCNPVSGEGEESTTIHHAVELINAGIKYCKCCNPVSGEGEENTTIHHAVELINAGIKFKPCTEGIKRIHFDRERATIYLPHIKIQDSTEVLFRNLIAFEMCMPSQTNYVACYVWLMDQLIDSEEDVALLRRKGIITNYLGSDGEVAQLFNGLCKGVTGTLRHVFDGLTEKVNDHYKSEYKVQCAQFVRDHFSSVWKAFAWAAAIFILVLTVVQTVVSILQVYK